jgi:TonB family protein
LQVKPKPLSVYVNPLVAGTIILDAWIDESGNVAGVKVIRSIQLYDSLVTDAVRQWKFAPARLEGRAIAVVQSVRVSVP